MRDFVKACMAKDGTEKVRALLKSGAPPDTMDGGYTVLMLATQCCQIDTIKILLEAGADPNYNRDTQARNTALMEAVLYGRPDLVRTFLDGGADVNLKNGLGYTALGFAAHNGLTEISKMLLEAGANPNAGVDPNTEADPNKNKEPLYLATDKEYADVAKVLLEAGAASNKWLAYYSSCLKNYKAMYGPKDVGCAKLLTSLAVLLEAMGRFDEAEPKLRKALEIVEASSYPIFYKLAIRLDNLGRVLQAMKRFEEAESLLRRALETMEANWSHDHPHIAFHLWRLGSLLQTCGNMNEGKRLLERARGIFSSMSPKSQGVLDNKYYYAMREILAVESISSDSAESTTLYSKRNKELQEVGEKRGQEEHEKVISSKITCTTCSKNFNWEESYWHQDTPDSQDHNPPGHGIFRPRAFCPHCGFLIAEWDINRQRDADRWKWYGENAKLNVDRELPPNPLFVWGKSLPLEFHITVSEDHIDIEQVKQRKEGSMENTKSNTNISPTEFAEKMHSMDEGARFEFLEQNLQSYHTETKMAAAAAAAEFGMTQVGILYELVNLLAAEENCVKDAAATAIWNLDKVGYALRSLKDEYQYPNKMSSSEAINAVDFLKKHCKDNKKWDQMFQENWDNY